MSEEMSLDSFYERVYAEERTAKEERKALKEKIENLEKIIVELSLCVSRLAMDKMDKKK